MALTGFTDAFYKNLSLKYPAEGKPEMARKGEPYVYVETGGLHPDVWFNPQEVWQIAAADITSSPGKRCLLQCIRSEPG